MSFAGSASRNRAMDELAAEQAQLLEKESGELEEQASRLPEEIKELGGGKPSRIS